MKKSMIKLSACILALLTLLTVIAACGNNTTDPETTTASPSAGEATTSAPETTAVVTDEFGREWIEDGLPETADYKNRTFTVHTRGNVEKYEWLATDQTGEILNDAIFARNSVVEERLKIKLNVIAEGSWADYGSASIPKIRASIKAGNGEYDLLAGYEGVTSLAVDGLLIDLNTLDAINFDKPWWSDNFKKELEIGGATYFGIGSLSTSMLYSMDCIFVNTDILSESAGQSYNIYKTVKENKWTYEEYLNLAEKAWIDKNGNGVVDSGDTIGAAYPDNSNSVIGFFYATGNKLTNVEDDMLTFNGLNVEKVSNAIDDIITVLYKGVGVYPANKSALDFANGDIMFFMRWLYWGQTQYAQRMDHYGIVPIPMQNSDQENYVTPVQAGMHMYCIPSDVTSREENAVITEAFAAESYRSLMPKYFEVVLKTKYAKDAETSQMLDLMYETVAFDFAYIFRSNISYWSAVQGIISSQNNTLSSAYKALSKSANVNLKSLVEALTPKQ